MESTLRYFTDKNHYLYWIWDESAGRMYYTACDPADPIERWNCVQDEADSRTPENLNEHSCGTYEPGDAFYAFETDENWRPLLP